jgi:hypothetical protein
MVSVPAWWIGRRKETLEWIASQGLEDRLGRLLQGRLAGNAGEMGQVEEDDRIRVSDLAAMPGERRCQANMIQSRHHKSPFFSENSRLRTLGQNDTPPLQAGTDAAAIHHRRLPGHVFQRSREGVGDLGLIEAEHKRQSLQADSVELPVISLDQIPSHLKIAATADPSDLQFTVQEPDPIHPLLAVSHQEQNSSGCCGFTLAHVIALPLSERLL